MITIFASTANSDWTSFAFALVGILIGGLVTHTFTKDRDARMRQAILDREAEIRRREFIRLIVRGCYRIQHPTTPDHAPEDPWIAYNTSIGEIGSEFPMCEGDFQHAEWVSKALITASNLQKQDVEDKARDSGKSPRQVLTGFLTAISAATSASNEESEQDVGERRR